jgi:hypothetical protein
MILYSRSPLQRCYKPIVVSESKPYAKRRSESLFAERNPSYRCECCRTELQDGDAGLESVLIGDALVLFTATFCLCLCNLFRLHDHANASLLVALVRLFCTPWRLQYPTKLHCRRLLLARNGPAGPGDEWNGRSSRQCAPFPTFLSRRTSTLFCARQRFLAATRYLHNHDHWVPTRYRSH